MATEGDPRAAAPCRRVSPRGAAAAGRDPNALTVALHLPTLVTDEHTPWHQILEALHYPGWKYDDMAICLRLGRPASCARPGQCRGGGDPATDHPFGTPSQVAGRIEDDAAAAGGNLHFIARSDAAWSGSRTALRRPRRP